MSSPLVGLGCLLVFAISQGARDAFFGNVFQSISFLLVGVLAFGTSTVCFSALALLRRPRNLAKLFASPAVFAGLNLTTAIAWLSFFYGLKQLEPVVVATLYNGVGPLTVLGVQALGWTTAKRSPPAAELVCYIGVAGTLAALAVVVLTNRSGLSVSNFVTQGGALAVVIGGGAMITISHMIARWFNDVGVTSDAVMGTRFLLAMLAAAVAEMMVGEAAMRPSASSVPFLAATAFALITIPSFMLQLGIARASPLAVNVMRSLGPVFVFAVQQIDAVLWGDFDLRCELLHFRDRREPPSRLERNQSYLMVALGADSVANVQRAMQINNFGSCGSHSVRLSGSTMLPFLTEQQT